MYRVNQIIIANELKCLALIGAWLNSWEFNYERKKQGYCVKRFNKVYWA